LDSPELDVAKIRRAHRLPKDAASVTPARHEALEDERSLDELKAFADQSRWLLEYHNRRADGISQRAVALLGFAGVILALIPTALALPKNFNPSPGLWAFLAVATAGLLSTAVLCVLALSLKPTRGPKIGELRALLRDYTTGKRIGRVHRDIAETLLHGMSVTASSPLDFAFLEANSRARAFKWAVRCLLLGLLGLSGLIFLLFQQMGGVK
jgi:hypothetical protein